MPLPDRETAIAEFAKMIGSAVADALQARPPAVVLPEAAMQALVRIASGQIPIMPHVQPPMLDPISMIQQQTQLLKDPKLHRVLRYDDDGRQYVQEITVPQLMAEMCDLLSDQVQLLEDLAAKGAKKRRKRTEYGN